LIRLLRMLKPSRVSLEGKKMQFIKFGDFVLNAAACRYFLIDGGNVTACLLNGDNLVAPETLELVAAIESLVDGAEDKPAKKRK